MTAMVSLAPGSFWWVGGSLHLVTGIFVEDGSVTTWSAEARYDANGEALGDVAGCWPIEAFLQIAKPAHRALKR